MPRKPCFWTRKLELLLVEFVRKKECIWKPIGNTNHHIQQKYKAYAEFAAKLGAGFTARSVRDRWVNIRSTYNHNLRKVLKSKETAKTSDDIYTPCWPLWKPLQFLSGRSNKEDLSNEDYKSTLEDAKRDEIGDLNLEAALSDINESELINIRQRGQRTDRPRKKNKIRKIKANKCKELLDNLLIAMAPLSKSSEVRPYWFFGKHVTERLNSMKPYDAECAGRDILSLLKL